MRALRSGTGYSPRGAIALHPQAAVGREGPPIPDLGSAEALAPRATHTAYAIASIKLYSRLWLELERLSELFAASAESDLVREIEVRAMGLRLELVLLLDACDSARWRSMLGTARRLELRATLQGLFEALAVPQSSLGCRVVSQAQDWLFDAALETVSQEMRSIPARIRLASQPL